MMKKWNSLQTAVAPSYIDNPISSKGIGSFEESAETLFDSLGQIIPYDRIGIALMSADGELVQLRWLKSKVPAEALKQGFSSPLKGSSLERILLSNQARIIDDLEDYLAKNPQSESTRRAILDGVRSSLTCPLLSSGRGIGFIFFSSFTPKTYSKDHLHIYSLIASTLASSLEKSTANETCALLKTHEDFYLKILHDLRNPLTVLKAHVDEACRGHANVTKDRRVKADPMLKQINIMVTLLDDLQDALDMGSTEFSIRKQEVDLDEFLSVTATAAEALCRAKQISFSLKKTDKLPQQIYLDPQRITQSLGNLISNSIKFSLPKTLISLEVTAKPDALYFTLRDQGCGIPRFEIPHIFEASSRKTKSTPTKFEKCRGLGLSIVKQIIEGHGGQVWAESILGIGSSFHFKLPYR